MSLFVPIPDFQTLMRPVLVAVDGEVPRSHAQIRDVVAPVLGVSDEDRQVMLPSGTQALFTNRVAWAISPHDAGWIASCGQCRLLILQYRCPERGLNAAQVCPAADQERR